MALEAPIVASDAPAIAEVLEGGAIGRLVARGDSDALASALLDLANSPQTRESYAAVGRQRFKDSYELAAIADGTLEMYRTALLRRAERSVHR
jgi:glycosyltransferase involved in cell wall biosynthesis